MKNLKTIRKQFIDHQEEEIFRYIFSKRIVRFVPPKLKKSLKEINTYISEKIFHDLKLQNVILSEWQYSQNLSTNSTQYLSKFHFFNKMLSLS